MTARRHVGPLGPVSRRGPGAIPRGSRAGLLILLSLLAVAPVPRAVAGAPEDDGASVCSHGRAAGWAAAVDRTEPTANQKLWSALFYGISLAVDPQRKAITGDLTLTLGVLADSLGQRTSIDSLELDLDNAYSVRSVAVSTGLGDYVVRPFEHANDLLRFPLLRPVPTGSGLAARIRYEGTPPTDTRDGLNFSSVGGQPMAWCFGGPRGARRWFPCKDHPQDKAELGVWLSITAPKGHEVVANGRLARRTETDTTVTFLWEERHPIATYLVSFTAYPYAVYQDRYTPAGSPADSMPIVFYNVPASQELWRPVQAQVKDMLAAFAARYGEYPFLDEKYGHAQVPFSGGMEHQTITSLGATSETVVAHEISHSWWGDDVTCRTFRDIWLNEGFATWSEALWLEATRGTAAYHTRMADTRYFGAGTIFVPETSDPARIYDKMLSYYKGSWVLHMLRHLMDDETFFRGLREYRARHAGGTARTADFAAVMSEVAQRNLRPFLDRWIMGEGYPIYRYDWSKAADGPGWKVHLRLRQVQQTPVFPMPVDVVVGIEASDGDTLRTFAVESVVRDSVYTLDLPRRPLSVAIDPEEWVLRRVMPPIPAPTFTRPMLVVNGVPWRDDTGARLRAAYQAQTFTAGYDFDFWENQPPPADGYPSSLPVPLGHGPVPGSVLARYRMVLWVGNNFGDDLAAWTNTPMHAYLEAGGNVLLLVPSARTFLLEPYRSWLGVSWAEGDSSVTLGGSMEAWLPDLDVAGAQTDVSFFRLEPESEGSRLLYADRSDPGRGFGALRFPPSPDPGKRMDGRFVLIGGRPYRWDRDDLRAAMAAILPELLPRAPAGTPMALRTAAPNPFRDRTKVAFFLPAAMSARLQIFDVAGRRVRTLRDGPSPAGWNAETWSGTDAAGNRAASGVYFLRLDAGGETAAERLVRIR